MVGCEKQTSRIAEEHVVAAAMQLGLEIPKGKIKGERAADPASPSSKRVWILLLLLIIVAAIGAGVWFLGNPMDLMNRSLVPGIQSPTARVLPAPAVAAPSELRAPAPIPAPIPGSFSILIGTYDNAHQAEQVDTKLKALNLTPYAIDILMAPEDLQRRILLGRFATREEADAALAKLGPAFTTARVIPGAQERLRVVIP
jgi:hypothetical protein